MRAPRKIAAPPASFARTTAVNGQLSLQGWGNGEFIGAHGRMPAKKVEQTKNLDGATADWKSGSYTGLWRFESALDGEPIRKLRMTGR